MTGRSMVKATLTSSANPLNFLGPQKCPRVDSYPATARKDAAL